MAVKVHTLGTGGALVSEGRANTSIAVEADSQALLIECAGTPNQALLRAGIQWTQMTDVIITHRHADHLYALPGLALHLYVEGLQRGEAPHLRIHGPQDALDIVKTMLDATGLSGHEELQIDLDQLPGSEHSQRIGDLDVTTFPVDHGDVTALGISVSCASAPSRSLLYSGDTSLCDAVIDQGQNVSLIFHECSSFNEPLEGHTRLAEIEELAERVTAERIVLVHLPSVSPLEEGAIRRRLRARFGGRVQLGEDGMVWEL